MNREEQKPIPLEYAKPRPRQAGFPVRAVFAISFVHMLIVGGLFWLGEPFPFTEALVTMLTLPVFVLHHAYPLDRFAVFASLFVNSFVYGSVITWMVWRRRP